MIQSKNIQNAHDPQAGTKTGRFLAQRGVLAVKEQKPFGGFRGVYGGGITLNTIIISTIKGPSRDISFGLRLDALDTADQSIGGVSIDFDELDELQAALSFMFKTADEFSVADRDYTEILYFTKDGAKFGFYQDVERNQLAFVNVDEYREAVFFDLSVFQGLSQALADVKNYLNSRGAK